MSELNRIRIIDSHTGGEPTRVVVSGGPPLSKGPLSSRLAEFRASFDHYRTAIVDEPRGSEAIVGALICEPEDPTCTAGVIFFNNVGYLGMCGHGTIGLAVTLAHLGRIQPGLHRVETPVGVVEVELHSGSQATVFNIACYRHLAKVPVEVASVGTVVGDVAWGGNWFFLTDDCPVPLIPANLDALTKYAWRIRSALNAAGLRGTDDAEIDHIEIHSSSRSGDAGGKNFVLCPGSSYDRSPCGTGTSAKVACLYSDGVLTENQVWRQESLIGSVFEASVQIRNGQIFPKIRGTAYVTSEATLILSEADPFRWGLTSTARS